MKKIILSAIMIIMTVHSYAALLVDDAETGTLTNTLGGPWQTYADASSSVTFTPDESPPFAGNYCRKLSWGLGSGPDQYAGAVTALNASWDSVDLTAYNVIGVRFYAKGTGNYTVGLGTDDTRATYNHYLKPLNPDPGWQLYEMEFSTFAQGWGPYFPWDPTKVFAVQFTGTGAAGAAGTLYVDNIEFYTAAEASPPADPNVIILNPKVNQAGFLPSAKKYFTVVTNTASTSDTFRIFDSSGNTAFTGTITGAAVDDRQSTGEGVFKCDFSALTAPGTYHVAVNGRESFNFMISDSVYDRLFKNSLRCFYLIRCGTDINDPVTGLSHKACHTAPDTIRGGAGTRDMSGGWHNAGDYGKWAHEEAISCAYMMWLYELKKDKMKNLKNNIPESGNAISDLLDEAKWGLDWLLKLQNPDGSVYHKSDTEPDFCYGTKPEFDPFTRYAAYQKMDQPQAPSSIDAGVFTAAMAQAARVYAGIMPGFAKTCKEAAIKSWDWLKNHRGIGQTDPYYTDAASWQEEQWAMAEIFRLTGDTEAGDMFDADIDINALQGTGWQSPQFFGYFSIWQDKKTPQALKDKVKAKIIALCDIIAAKAANSGYGVARLWNEYYWESNEDLMHSANNLLMGYIVTGTENYRDKALDQLGYMLGNNSLNKTFITKTGTNYASGPYQWIYYDYGILLPGWAAGGPNEFATGAGSDIALIDLINLGTPPAKCWLDTPYSYASNEGETSENAALVFLSGFFLSEEDAAAGIDTGAVPVANPDDIIAYPSPCNMTMGDEGITFFNLPAGALLQVYNLSGGLVHKTTVDAPDGVYYWKLVGGKRNEATAPGVYVYTVTAGGGFVKRGKVAVIR